MPLLPAFEGAVNAKDASSLRAVLHWQYMCISRGGNSLLERLSQNIADPSQYIVFFGLRTFETLGMHTVTEQVYVHSKVMIVDDRTAIIGKIFK